MYGSTVVPEPLLDREVIGFLFAILYEQSDDEIRFSDALISIALAGGLVGYERLFQGFGPGQFVVDAPGSVFAIYTEIVVFHISTTCGRKSEKSEDTHVSGFGASLVLMCQSNSVYCHWPCNKHWITRWLEKPG